MRIIILLLIIGLTACSSSDDVYLEGYVTDRDKKSVEVELLGATNNSSNNITVKVKSENMLSDVDEGESIVVKCKGINWWANPPEAEALTVETISFNEY